jgi:hypothetical protein
MRSARSKTLFKAQALSYVRFGAFSGLRKVQSQVQADDGVEEKREFSGDGFLSLCPWEGSLQTA